MADRRSERDENQRQGAILANPLMIAAYKEGIPQWQALSRGLEDCKDRVAQRGELSVPLFGALRTARSTSSQPGNSRNRGEA